MYGRPRAVMRKGWESKVGMYGVCGIHPSGYGRLLAHPHIPISPLMHAFGGLISWTDSTWKFSDVAVTLCAGWVGSRPTGGSYASGDAGPRHRAASEGGQAG